MSREFPDFVDPWKAADGERTFHGTMPLVRLKRLTPLLAGGETGVAEFTARFRRDREGLVTIDLNVTASLVLLCQRSMEPYAEPIDRPRRLAVIPEPAIQPSRRFSCPRGRSRPRPRKSDAIARSRAWPD